MVAWVPSSRLADLAAEDEVQWIEPPLPPLEDTNDSLRALTQADTVNGAPYGLESIAAGGIKATVGWSPSQEAQLALRTLVAYIRGDKNRIYLMD